MSRFRILLALATCLGTGMASAQDKGTPYWEPPTPEGAAPRQAPDPSSLPPGGPGRDGACLAGGPRLALTFDDGPHPTLTPLVLHALGEANAQATFFLVGQRAQAWPEVVRAMVAGGHEVGIHTQTHADLSRLQPEAAWRQIALGEASIRGAAPGAQILYWRAPYGATTAALLQRGREHGLMHAGWSVDPQDWRPGRQPKLIEHVLVHARDRAVVLLHDIHAGTVHRLPQIIHELQALGFQLVTLSQMNWPTCPAPEEAPRMFAQPAPGQAVPGGNPHDPPAPSQAPDPPREPVGTPAPSRRG